MVKDIETPHACYIGQASAKNASHRLSDYRRNIRLFSSLFGSEVLPIISILEELEPTTRAERLLCEKKWHDHYRRLGKNVVSQITEFEGHSEETIRLLNRASAKLNELQVRVIRRLLEIGTLSINKIAALFSVDKGTIRAIRNKKTWKWLPTLP